MPSSRQRARKGSSGSGGRKSPRSTANVSELLSPEPVKRDELIPTPTKKRRVDLSSSADEDDASSSPLCSKRLWETFESNYKYLMEEDIIRTCRRVLSPAQTGDQYGEDVGATSSSRVSLTEFIQQLSELSQWLTRIDARKRSTESLLRVEKYLDQGFAEELLQRTPRKKLLHEYAQDLLSRHPDMEAEIGQRLANLDAQWMAVERQAAGIGPNIDSELLSQIIEDIYEDVDDLEIWYEELIAGLPNSHTWLQTMERLSAPEVKERMTGLEARQKDIETRSRAITQVLKVIDKLHDFESEALLNSDLSTELVKLHRHTQQLQDNCHAAWLQSLELLYCTEQILSSSQHQTSAPEIESGILLKQDLASSDPFNLSEVVVGSWGRDSGFSPTNDKKETVTEATTLPTSESASLDILPFSEDEYEKIESEVARMRGKSQEFNDNSSFLRLQERALYEADLCYHDEVGATLHRRSHTEVVLRRQTASGRLGRSSSRSRGGEELEDRSSLFLSESELFSSACNEWDASVSRSAEVLLHTSDQQPSLEVSQVHAVLSVTPKKAYYRMTALDHEMANESNAHADVSKSETEEVTDFEVCGKEVDRPRPALLDITLAQLSTIGEEDSSENGFLPPSVGLSSPAGQKRRYSKSACAIDVVTSTPKHEASSLSAIPWDQDETDDLYEDEDSFATLSRNQSVFRHGSVLERSASESSVIDTTNRSSSWRELINQLEHDVRHSGSSAGLLIPNDSERRQMCEDDTGSLADESASSGGGDDESENSRLPPSQSSSASLGGSSGNGVGQSLRGVHGGRVKRTRRRTCMQLAEQAELIVQTQSRSIDSAGSDSDHLTMPAQNAVVEDSLDQAWDNYQAPMYPSTYDDDDAEEKLDLNWDEQLDSQMDTSNASNQLHVNRSPNHCSEEEANTTIEDFIAQSSMMLERARYSRSLPPSADVTAMSALSDGDGEKDEVTDLEREVARQSDWLAACDDNLSCLDQLKESLADSGVEDDLEPIRQQVEHLLKQWNVFKEETLGRLKLIEGLHRIHEEADMIKRETQRLADILDAPTDPYFVDAAQLDKLSSTLEYYESNLPSWQITVDEMYRALCCSLEEEQVDYLDVRKCHAENLHLLCQWLFSLHTRTATKLREINELREAYGTLLSKLFECNEGLNKEEHLLRCTQLAIDIMNYTERETAINDLKSVKDRLQGQDSSLAECEELAGNLSSAFTFEHWQHIDSRLTTMGSRLLTLSESCDRLLDTLSSSRVRPPPIPQPLARSSPKVRRRTTSKMSGRVGETAARKAVNTSRGRRLWRCLRASLPYQLALLVLFGCVYYLVTDYESDGRMSSLLFSPQLRHALGSPY